MSTMSEVEEIRGRKLIPRGREDPKDKLVENFINNTRSLEATEDILDPCKMSEILKELNGKPEQFPIVLMAQHKCVMELTKRCLQAEDIIKAKTENIHALEKELHLQREVARDPAMIKLVTRPRSTASRETQTSINMADLDDIDLQLMTGQGDILRLGNELVEKDERITEYESELQSQREQAKRDMEAKDEIIQALERELEVQREKLVENFINNTRSLEATEDILDPCKMSEILKELNGETEQSPIVLTAQHKCVMELTKRCLQAEDIIKAKTENIHALEKELHLKREVARDPAMIKMLSNGPQTTLHNEQHKTDLINTEINTLEYQVIKTERDALKLQVECLRDLCEEAAGLSGLLYNEITGRNQLTQEKENFITERDQLTQERDDLIRERDELIQERDNLITERDELTQERDHLITENDQLTHERDDLITEYDQLTQERDDLITERDQLTQERDDLLFVSERQVADMEDMQTENEALKCETEYLQGQCNAIATIEGQIKTVTAEQQRLKEVRDHMQLDVENFWDQCKDIAALAEQRDKLILQSKCQAGDTKAIEKARDALKIEKNIGYQCMDAATPKEQLSIATVQHPKFRKGIRVLVLCIILILIFGVLLWIMRYPPINYGTHFASRYKMSSYRNIISATARHSNHIIL